ncbi:concanavalin A-like lectin/glucanase [Corynespora cassiicola Philippines]|uniref:Concanavalin A-like lectin/glucanase n=1 Tax=Corynespora cassiicola Philippines TaxID=1448308 RepID=A0A2T2N472_CORCC|nr:concanavalin A-like lectin/glucanase [Corynespora cassiicola Philippines]
MKLAALLGVACWASAALGAFDLNRAGAVLKAPSGDSFTSVTGTFNVPNLSGNSRLSVWVGIGDSAEQTYVLGGGIVFNRTLSSWAAFYPQPSTDTTSQVPVSNGNSIRVTVNIQEGAGGSVTIENTTQNRRVTQTLAAPENADASRLTALAADWWVQGYQVTPGELLTTPNFGTLQFTACSATTKSGKTLPLTGAGAYELQGTSGQMYSRTTISANGVSIRRQ